MGRRFRSPVLFSIPRRSVFAGSFVIGIDASAAPVLNVAMYAIASGSFTTSVALLASTVASHAISWRSFAAPLLKRAGQVSHPRRPVARNPSHGNQIRSRSMLTGRPFSATPARVTLNPGDKTTPPEGESTKCPECGRSA